MKLLINIFIISLFTFILCCNTSCIRIAEKKHEFYRELNSNSKMELIGVCPIDKISANCIDCYQFLYDENERIYQIKYLFEGDISTNDPYYGVSIIKIEYLLDTIVTSFYDYKYKPKLNNAGVQKEIIVLENNGKPKEKLFFDVDNKPCTSKKTKKITYKYNDSDNNVTKYFNQQEYNSYVLVQSDNIYESNNLIQAKNIYKKNGENDSIVNISYKYNRNNLLTFATATDNNMNFLDDYHYRFFDDLGNQIEIKSSKRHRKLIKGTDVSIIKYKYDDCGNMIEEKFFDYYDNETVNKEGISKIRYVYNNENQIIEIINLNHKDNLVSDSDGIAKIVRTFILDTVLFKGSSILINENYLDEFNNILEKKEDIISEYAKTEASKQFIFALRSRREIGLTQTIERIKYAINLNPYYYEAYKSLGEYYLDEEKYNLAEEAFLKAANNNDSSFSSEIFSELAKVTFYLEEYNKSLDYINRSINLEIGSEIDDRYMYSCPVGQKLLYRVEIKIQLGLYQSAINDCDLLERMLNSYPSTCFYQFEMFNFLKGYIYTFLIKGNYLEAIESLNRAIEMNSNDGSYFYTRGSAYYFLKYFDNACRDFKKSADLGFPDGINAVKNACN